MQREQQGVTMLVVLVMLSVMLLGSLALARMTEVGTLASGNAGYREAALQASEVALNDAFDALVAIPNEENNIPSWYWNTPLTTDADGIPNVDWKSAKPTTVGPYTAYYIAERICTPPPVTNSVRQCLVRRETSQLPESRSGREKIDSVNSRQFRITVRVEGHKNTLIFIQALITKG